MLAPTIEQIAKEYQGQFVVGKINVDEQPELSSEFGIMSIPTLMVFKEGKVVATQMGVQPKPVIEQMLKNA
jgi:thioredoxin 1